MFVERTELNIQFKGTSNQKAVDAFRIYTTLNK